MALPAINSLATAAGCGSLVRDFGRIINADRCFLYVRDPVKRLGQIAALWRRSDSIPDLPDDSYHGFEPEPESLFKDDPMFAAALSGHPATYIADVLDAGDLLNVEFEKTYRHRALVHINLFDEGQLWGVLQPAMSFEPREWSSSDRDLVVKVRLKYAPLLMAAMQGGPWRDDPTKVLDQA